MLKRSAVSTAAALALLLASGAARADSAVVVTSKPIHALVSGVMAGIGAPELLVDGQTSPHAYAMKPSDARKVHRAKVFFRTSESLEPFTAKLVASLPKSVDIVTLEETPGLKLLDRREGGAFEAGHDHGASHPQGHGKSQSQSASRAGGHHHDHGHEEHIHDPHFWLDPDNAKAMVRHIADVLSEWMPDKAATIRSNAEAEISRLDALASDLARELAPFAGKPFMVYHDAYQYLEKRYGLTAVGTVTVSPELPPSGKRLSELRQKISSAGAVCVFAEPYLDPRAIAVVVEGTGTRTATLDPEGTALEAGPDLYYKLLRNLATNLTACLTRP